MRPMTKLWLIVPLVLLAWPAWSTSCADDLQNGESFNLELLAVTVDGERIDDVSGYDGYDVQISNAVNRYEVDGITEAIELSAFRSESRSGERNQYEVVRETYPAADRSWVGE
jgi:hypothetical protein